MIKPWALTFELIAKEIAQRSKDPSSQVGAVIVDKKNQIISMGYNGPPRGIDDVVVPLDTRPDKYPWIIHAEENAIYFGLERQRLNDCTIYITGRPCASCCARIVHVGIKEVRYDGSSVPKMCDDENWSIAQKILKTADVFYCIF